MKIKANKKHTATKDSWKGYNPCHEDHKEFELGGGVIMGASCINPREGYDIYIGFDRGMRLSHTPYPWEAADNALVEFLWPITDMCAPKSIKEFRKLINWVEAQLKDGKRIHMGCIGGHGRTGLVLSALIKQINDTEDAITWVRENYCHKAVESTSQINFLHKHFTIKKAEPTKKPYSPQYKTGSSKYPEGYWDYPPTTTKKTTGNDSCVIEPLAWEDNIWKCVDKLKCEG